MHNRDLSVQNLHISYGSGAATVRALDNVSLHFRQGQLTLIMGPSGSGKTTLLSLLGCILTPDSGEVTVMNTDVSSLSEESRASIRRCYIG
ncbi:MAG: ATP-binding cassette domain-containing protein, partial [Blastocatellia bacterium]